MIRFDDARRTLTLSVRDLVDEAGVAGHLVVGAPADARRLAAGRAVHVAWQTERAGGDASYRAEVPLTWKRLVDGWAVELVGRVDGLGDEAGRTLVEEVKSTAMPLERLERTRAEDWPGWLAQLDVYLWMLHEAGYPEPTGRLVLVSLADGSRHVLGVPLAAERVGADVVRWVRRLLVLHEDRLDWLARRRTVQVPRPFDDWRPGQERIAAGVEAALDANQVLLVEAPTGLGKTAAVLHGALRHALRTGKQVFWATSRNIQHVGLEAALARLAGRGMPLRAVTVASRERACLNDVVSCRPDACRFAASYADKVHDTGAWRALVAGGPTGSEAARALGSTVEACPYQLVVDATDRVDVVVGDVNHALDPSSRLRRCFDDDVAGGWVLVVDEAHQLVERARGWLSPRVDASSARRASKWLAGRGPRVAVFRRLADEVVALVVDEVASADGPVRGSEALAAPSKRTWKDLASRIDEVSLDYFVLDAGERHGAATVRAGVLVGDGVLPLGAPAPVASEGDDDEGLGDGPLAGDPWRDLSRAVLRFAATLLGPEPTGELRVEADAVAIATGGRGREALQLVCLDPSGWLGPRLAVLGGLVFASATLSPSAYYRDLYGIEPDRLRRVTAPSPFPAENRAVLVVPSVSTAFKDRVAHAGKTAALLTDMIDATPGNVAVYLPSFQMLSDLVGRVAPKRHALLVQEPGMEEGKRRAWLTRMAATGDRVVLVAVLGGVFAEGIDLPPGALSGVIVVGPALPPVGLERDLLRHHFEERYGAGFMYASLIPGLTRVVQAAGRLHRRPEDRGVIVLVDRRFAQKEYASLLPPTWQVERTADPAAAIRAFWS